MEISAKIKEVQKIMGKNFIGKDELEKISPRFKISVPENVPNLPFDLSFLKKVKKDYILILGAPVTLNKMREIFGIDPEKSEPCFYNQDWYLKEKFAAKETLKIKWYLISKKISAKTRGKNPEIIAKSLKGKESLPTAVLAAFVFFAYYFLTKEMLWKNDFIWCKDKDVNGDRIYVGRYFDPKKINKNGFNIHRHLSIKPNYGAALEIL
jgi:hypothetical protein